MPTRGNRSGSSSLRIGIASQRILDLSNDAGDETVKTADHVLERSPSLVKRARVR